MKTLLSAAALAALVALPVLAQAARAPAAQSLPNAVVAWDDVIEDGKVIGKDPDPNVRLQLRRDYPSINH